MMDGEISVEIVGGAIQTHIGFMSGWEGRKRRKVNNEWKGDLKRLTYRLRFARAGKLQTHCATVPCLMVLTLRGGFSPFSAITSIAERS
ncbi:hypothetical protein HYR99_24130 [Candidatus Poribacteria bacterium]|nr:hypothetical protein [Candidatus Poribacteria bacterium]